MQTVLLFDIATDIHPSDGRSAMVQLKLTTPTDCMVKGVSYHDIRNYTLAYIMAHIAH